jgi:hypothetical protein
MSRLHAPFPLTKLIPTFMYTAMEPAPFTWHSSSKRVTTPDYPAMAPIASSSRKGRSREIESPSTSSAPTPEPRPHRQIPVPSSSTAGGDPTMAWNLEQSIYHSTVLTPPDYRSSGASRANRCNDNQQFASGSRAAHKPTCPSVPPTPSSASQSDDEDDGDETDQQDFADKSFKLGEQSDAQRRGSLGKSRTQSAGVIPDEVLNWLSHTSTSHASYSREKGKESGETTGTKKLSRRHTFTDTPASDLVESPPLETEEPAEVTPGIASTLPQEIVLHVSMQTSQCRR